MHPIRRRLSAAGVASAVILALTAGVPARAADTVLPPTGIPTAPAPATVNIAQLATMLTNMGYVVKPSSDGKGFSVVVTGNYDLTMTFNIVASDGSVIAFVYLQKFVPAQLAKLNMQALLEENDVSLSYFSLNKSGDDRLLYIQRDLAAPAVSPLTLRVMMTDLQQVTFKMGNIWDASKWTPATTP